MTIEVNDSSTWRQLVGVSVNDSGTWREIAEVYVNDSGTWRSVFVNDTVAMADLTVTHSATSPTNAHSAFTLEADGGSHITRGNVDTDHGNWITPTTNSGNYSAKGTIQTGPSGTGTAQGTFGSFAALTADQEWGLLLIDNTAGATSTMTVLVEIAKTSDTGTVLASFTLTLTCNVVS